MYALSLLDSQSACQAVASGLLRSSRIWIVPALNAPADFIRGRLCWIPDLDALVNACGCIICSPTALPPQIAISGPKAGERVPDFGSLIGTMLIQQLAGRGVEAGGEGGATRDVRNRCAATRIRTGCIASRLQGRAGQGSAMFWVVSALGQGCRIGRLGCPVATLRFLQAGG